jgi:hypothetical protein
VPLHELIPLERRRDVWHQLRQDGFAMPGLKLTSWERTVGTFTVLKTAASIAWATHPLAGLLSTFPLSALAYGVSRPRAVHVPLGIHTVGELVMYLTSCRDHRHSGYRWSRGDIAWRVRFLVAEAFGLGLHEVQEHHSFLELGAE